jgi:hypothetical protein
MNRDDVLDRAVAFFFDDFWKLAVVGALLIGAVHITSLTWGQITNPPLQVKVGIVFVVLGGLIGYVAMSTWYEAPTPDWNLIVQINTNAGSLINIKKATDAVIRDLADNMHHGDLGHVTGTSIFYCYWWNKDPESPVGMSSWAKVPDDAELLGSTPSMVLDEIHQMRESYETTIHKADRVRHYFPIIIRETVSHRLAEIEAAIEGHTAPELGGRTINESIDDNVPDELQPENVKSMLQRAGASDAGDEPNELLDELADDVTSTDGVDEVTDLPATTESGGDAVATDGGGET